VRDCWWVWLLAAVVLWVRVGQRDAVAAMLSSVERVPRRAGWVGCSHPLLYTERPCVILGSFLDEVMRYLWSISSFVPPSHLFVTGCFILAVLWAPEVQALVTLLFLG
jgi:hypothetical protein